VVVATGDRLETWRSIHNQVIPTAPLSAAEVAERSGRHRLTLAYVGGTVVGNATLRPPAQPGGVATVIVRILPPHRRKGHGTAYLAAELTVTRTLAPARIETVVHASNTSGLEFALKHGFVEHDRYVLDGDDTAFVDLHLTN